MRGTLLVTSLLQHGWAEPHVASRAAGRCSWGLLVYTQNISCTADNGLPGQGHKPFMELRSRPCCGCSPVWLGRVREGLPGPSRKEKTSVSPWSPLDLSAISSFSAQAAAQLTAWAPPGSLLWDEGHRCLISKSQWGLGICIGSKPRCWGCRVPPACQPGLRLHSLYFLPLHLLITHPKETGIIK